MSCKEEFIEIFKEKITRPGADALLNYLENKSDFFTAPASARYHLACEGGLCEHSLNVYHCLVDYLQRERVQELYGVKTHPTVGRSKFPLRLELLSPAHRPVQVTTDLPGFWAGSWKLVQKEMKGRYPKHFWPDDPADAVPTTRTKAKM